MTLKELFKQSTTKYHLELIAGESGIHKTVKWIYLLEDLNNISFIRGGELVITTGLANTYDNWLEDFFYSLEGKNISGIILNTGKYINQVPEILIEYCNRKNIPVFTMPWAVHIADIMQDCCNKLIKEQQEEDYLRNAFAGAMFNNTVDNTFIYQYDTNKQNVYFPFGIIALKNFPQEILAMGFNQLEQKYLILTRNNIQYAVLYPITETNLTSVTDYLHKLINTENVNCGISTIGQNINDLFSKRIEADKALKAAVAQNKSCCFYKDLGLYQIVLGISEHSILDNLHTRYLKTIINYDEKHNSNYLEILRYYIEFNSSVQQVADRTFTHRNTINYRINKIKEMLNSDLSSMEERCCIQLALHYNDLILANNDPADTLSQQ